jgi:hypothetical protein
VQITLITTGWWHVESLFGRYCKSKQLVLKTIANLQLIVKPSRSDIQPAPPTACDPLARMVEQASAVFGGKDKAIQWLGTPHKFGGHTPLDMVRTRHDARLTVSVRTPDP